MRNPEEPRTDVIHGKGVCGRAPTETPSGDALRQAWARATEKVVADLVTHSRPLPSDAARILHERFWELF